MVEQMQNLEAQKNIEQKKEVLEDLTKYVKDIKDINDKVISEIYSFAKKLDVKISEDYKFSNIKKEFIVEVYNLFIDYKNHLSELLTKSGDTSAPDVNFVKSGDTSAPDVNFVDNSLIKDNNNKIS